MKYDAMYFLRKFNAIPEEQWCVETYTDNGRYCALGHCGHLFSSTKESRQLIKLIENKLKIDVPIVNDGKINEPIYYNPYNLNPMELGKTPKERVMNALLLINAGVTL